MKIRWESYAKRGVIDIGNAEYTDEEIQEIVEEMATNALEVEWSKKECPQTE